MSIINCGKNESKFIPVITRKETTKVILEEILYIEQKLRIITIHTNDRAYSFYGKMDAVEKFLNENFYRCHKSFILNFKKVTSMEAGIFYLEGGKSIRLGKNKYQYTIGKYKCFLKGMIL